MNPINKSTYSNPCTNPGTLYLLGEKITSLEIPNSITAIKDYAFVGCDFTSVTLHSSVTSIGDYAFAKCSQLTGITIPKSVESIGNYAFMWTSLGEANISIQNPSIRLGEGVFRLCHISDLDFWPKAVLDIPNYTFERCNRITSLSIPEGITSVGDKAFSDCLGMTELTVPKTLNSFGTNVFRGCNNLSKVTWNAINCNDFNNDNLLFNETFKEKSKEGKLSSFTIGDEVAKIPAYLCYAITIPSLQIPNSVKTIGNYAFCASYLNELTLGNSLETIGAYAFRNNKIEELVIPNLVTTIGEGAFRNCSEIKDLTFGKALEHIGPYSFYECKGLTSIDLPSRLISIENFAFSGCSKLASVNISNSVTSIGDYAFNGTRLESIIIPNSVISIGDGAFSGCWNSSSIVLGNSVETIGHHAFNKCNLITHITIPASVKSIKGNAFPETLTKVEWNAIDCDYITVSGVTSLFSNCALTSIAFGNGVERIPSRICYYQSGLTEIAFPASMKTIGPNPLQGCSRLQKITSHIIEPMTVVLGLTDEQYAQLPLYIPKGTTDAYRNALGWADFLNMIEMTGEGKGDLNGDGSVDGGDVSILLEMVLAGGVSDEQKAVADLNGDGDVDGGDVSILLEMVLSGD